MDVNSDWDALVAKMICGSTLFLVSVICGLIPFKLAKIYKWIEPLDDTTAGNQKTKKPSQAITILLCIGGGILLATTFIHLLPDINRTIVKLIQDGLIPEIGFSLGEFFMMAGFFFIYLIEEIVDSYLHRHQHKKIKAFKEKNDEDIDMFIQNINSRNSSVVKRFSINSFSNEAKQTVDAFEITKNQLKNRSNQGHGHSHIIPPPQIEGEDMLVSSLRGLLIVLALSIHELFEGFAVGLERTSARVYFMFAAVSAHKFVIAFCIGVELMIQRTKPWIAFLYVIVYSIVSALGIGVGALLTSGPNADNLQVTNVIMQGLATGTLLYVSFFEVLSKDRCGLIAYVSIIGGFLLMFTLQYFAGITERQGL